MSGGNFYQSQSILANFDTLVYVPALSKPVMRLLHDRKTFLKLPWKNMKNRFESSLLTKTPLSRPNSKPLPKIVSFMLMPATISVQTSQQKAEHVNLTIFQKVLIVTNCAVEEAASEAKKWFLKTNVSLHGQIKSGVHLSPSKKLKTSVDKILIFL